MKEINEIIEHLSNEIYISECDGEEFNTMHLQKQLDNANKVAAKLQGAIDLFKEIEEL